MPSSFEIDVEVNLKPPNKAKMKKQLGDIDVSAFFGRMDAAGVKPGILDRLMKVNVGLSKGMLDKITLGLGVLTGIFGVLKRVPSILQASLKLMSIGFLLILKPMADLIGMILMPIAKAMIKLAMFLGDFKIGAGVGGIAGMVLAMLGAALLAPATLSAIATGAVVLAAAFIGAIFGSILGAIVGYAWGKLIGLEKGIVNTILTKIDGWFGLPEEGFFGKIINIIEEWVRDDKDKRSFWMVIADTITGDRVTGGKEGGKTNILSGILAGMGPFGMLADYARKSATGGIFTSPTPALIGEAGPEAVIPLNQLGSFGGTTININGIVDEYKFRDIIKDVVRQENTAHYGVTGGSI